MPVRLITIQLMHDFRSLISRWQSARIAEVQVLMTLKMFMCVSIAVAQDRSRKLRDLALASCNSSKELALTVMVKERNCIQHAMFAMVLSRSKIWMSLQSLSKKVFQMDMNS